MSPSPEDRESHDRHRILPVLAALGVLFLYAYLLTHIAAPLGLPSPVALAELVGWSPSHVFDSDGNVDSNLWIAETSDLEPRIPWDDERLILFGAIAGAFLSMYFLPLRWKQPSMVVWFLAAFLILYRVPATLGFVACHLGIYLAFHPRSPQRSVVSFAFGFLLCLFFAQGAPGTVEMGLVASAGLGAAFYALDRWALRSWLDGGAGSSALRGLVVHTPLLLGIAGAAYHGMTEITIAMPLGFLLFLWQWHRLMVYHADYNDGAVPADLPVASYLAVFMSPAVITNWTYSPYVGQAYGYQDRRFYCEDKNRTVMRGVRLLLLALFYVVAAETIVQGVVRICASGFGVRVYPFTTLLISDYMDGEKPTQISILLTTLLYQLRVLLVFGAVCHFRVGAYRLLGYKMDPQYDRPWQATNLVSLWRRFAFHFREFVVRCFYYPVFLRCFKKHRFLRVFFATFVATCIGNHIWGHVPDRMYSRGMELQNLTGILRAWPYYLLLGLGISLTQLYLMRKGRTRKPWTRDRLLPLDFVCAYLTMQFFALIHIFARPPEDGTVWDSLRLFLLGFGIDLG